MKPITEYFRERRRKNGYAYHCKDCRKSATQRWRDSHKEHIHLYSKKRWAENKDELRKKELKKRTENPQYRKDIWRRSNAKRLSTTKGKLGNSMRKRIHTALKGKKNGQTWESVVGYGLNDLVAHLEKQFLAGMTWENYGYRGWHIDHIIPVSAFNYDSQFDIDFKKCWALSNLRPLWGTDNFSKRDKLCKPFQPSLSMAI